jgi:hypothetical protein
MGSRVCHFVKENAIFEVQNGQKIPLRGAGGTAAARRRRRFAAAASAIFLKPLPETASAL